MKAVTELQVIPFGKETSIRQKLAEHLEEASGQCCEIAADLQTVEEPEA